MTNLGKESGVVEFKESISQLDKGTKSLVAMLNKYQHGLVYFGVKDNGDVIGMDIGDSTLEKIHNAVRTDISPKLIPKIELLESDDKKSYVSVEVSGHSIPYSWREKYFIRDATSDEVATPDILGQLFLMRGMDVPKNTQSDVQKLTFKHLFTLLESVGHHTRYDDEYFRSIGFFNDTGAFNMNAYLLSDQNSIPMQVVEFFGTDRGAQFNRLDCGGCCLINALEKMSGHVAGYMEAKSRIEKLERKDEYLFDFEAFREAWINACVHNAWRTGIPPSIFIFDDRIEIVSYGSIPFPLSEEEFYNGSSRPVNPSLFAMFAKLDLIEQSGHGVPRIVKSYGREAFRITEAGVTVTIPFKFTPRFVERRRANSDARKGLVERGVIVLDCLEEDPTAKLSDVAEKTGLSLSVVKKIVTSLKKEGFVTNEGTNRNSRWVVR